MFEKLEHCSHKNQLLVRINYTIQTVRQITTLLKTYCYITGVSVIVKKAWSHLRTKLYNIKFNSYSFSRELRYMKMHDFFNSFFSKTQHFYLFWYHLIPTDSLTVENSSLLSQKDVINTLKKLLRIIRTNLTQLKLLCLQTYWHYYSDLKKVVTIFRCLNWFNLGRSDTLHT